MQTTLGQLVTQLVAQYERLYHDHELATVAASVTLEDLLTASDARRARNDDITVRTRNGR